MQQGNLPGPDQAPMPEQGRKPLSVRTHIRAGQMWDAAEFAPQGQETTPPEAEGMTMPSAGPATP